MKYSTAFIGEFPVAKSLTTTVRVADVALRGRFRLTDAVEMVGPAESITAVVEVK